MNNLTMYRPKAGSAKLGMPISSYYAAIAAGLVTKPVRIGVKGVANPGHELDAINAARIAGKSNDEIRLLVSKLHQERATAEETIG